MGKDSADRQRLLHDALDHLQTALDLLDRAAAPPHIGAHVDLAAHQLADALLDSEAAAPPIASAQGAGPH
ncbi:MAG: hypothetical protein ACM3ZV_07975 [Bacillota bacterium]